MKITELAPGYADRYTAFIKKSPLNLWFVSDEYRRLLKRYTESDDHYLLAVEGDEIIGALPAFIKKTPLGSCLNSLPYYGSNGGIIEYRGNVEVKERLLGAFLDLAQEHNCISATLITSPFEQDLAFYEERTEGWLKSSRIGQVTPLYGADALMEAFHYKTRNSIRKAMKSGITANIDNSEAAFAFLYREHALGMGRVGGIPKDERFFECVREVCAPCADYDVYVARLDGAPIAALLLFYYNKTVEYFTPVTADEYRTMQPMSLIVYKAMQRAYSAGYSYWNWGGTHLTQTGVYDFKKKWGTRDYPYYYYTRVLDERVYKLTKEEALNSFKNFFVIPFEYLKAPQGLKAPPPR